MVALQNKTLGDRLFTAATTPNKNYALLKFINQAARTAGSLDAIGTLANAETKRQKEANEDAITKFENGPPAKIGKL